MDSSSDCYIRAVMPLKDYRLFMDMDSGSVVIADLSGRLNTVKYRPLEDEALFRDVKTDGDYVIWGNGCVRVSVKELMDVVLLGEI